MASKRQLSGYFIECENCGKEVYKTKSQYNKAKHHFCSNKCQKEFQHKELFEDRKCEICGKLFHVSKTSTQRFCSIKCQGAWQSTQTGELNPRRSGDYVKCEWCGKEYYVKGSKLKKGQHHFCSNNCRREWYSNVFSQDKEWKDKSRKRAVKMLESMKIGTDTKPQMIINDVLDDMNISYINEKGFEYYTVDNYLEKYNLIIEIMGDFWHCNPLKYSSPNEYEVHKKRIPRDKAKHTYFKNKYNVEILYLWENDIYNNLDVCISLINKYIENNGSLKNYHSFNYSLKNNNLTLNKKIIIPYQDMINA